MMLLGFAYPVQTPAADPLDTWFWRNPLPQGEHIYSFAYGNGVFVAVGESGTIMTSPDGINWAVRHTALSLDNSKFTGIAYGNGVFFAVGGGKIGKSTDGITWVITNDSFGLRYIDYINARFIALGGSTIATSDNGLNWIYTNLGTTDQFAAVAYGNGIYTLVGGNSAGTSGAILTSIDGVSWTSRSSDTTAQLTDVAFGNGTFIAVGHPQGFYGSGQGNVSVVLRSQDGISWTKSLEGTDWGFNGVAYANGGFYICGFTADGVVLYSADGVSWTTRQTAAVEGNFVIYYNNGIYLIGGTAGSIQTSSDGITWTRRTTGTTTHYYGVSYNNEIFVAVGGGGIFTSNDGISWLPRGDLISNLRCVAYGGGSNVAIGDGGGIFTSTDGTTWISVISGTNSSLRGVTYANGKFVAVGHSGIILTSLDSKTWTAQTSGNAHYLNGVAYGNGTFVVVGGTEFDPSNGAWHGGSGIILSSTDGISWTQRTSAVARFVYGVAYGNNKFVAVGGGGEILSSLDGITWTTQKPATDNEPNLLRSVAYGNGFFVAVGDGNKIFVSYDGIVWTSRAILSSLLFAVTYGNGSFVAVSQFGTILQSGVLNTHEIIATADPNGTINPAGSVRVTNGESQTFKITPNAGSQITDVFVDGVSRGTSYPSPYTYNFVNVTSDHTIRATFTGGKQVTGLTLSGTNGSMTPGNTQTLTATVRYSDNSTETLPNASAAWSSIDTSIATVGTTGGTSGVVQAVAQGRTTIAAEYKGVTGNLEITVGSPTSTAQHRGNLILVAGGGVKSDNTIKDATLYLADLVYSRFKSRFFTDEDIYYYRPISWVDLDGDGNDDHIVDVNLEKEEFSVADFGQRITQWAANQNSDGPLYIYLIDHGGMGSFELYPYQILTMAQLNTYLNVFQERTGRAVVVVIEACKSGSFISGIVQTGQNRIVITSAGRTEQSDSYLDLGGRISFTQLFMDRFSAGDSVSRAYQETINRLTTKGVPYSVMQPQLADGIGLTSATTYLGGSFGVAGLYPEIIEQTPSQMVPTGGSLTLQATLSSLERVTDVWAVITPPDYTTPTASGAFQTPTVGLPVVPLTRASTGERFSGTYRDFGTTGEYRITFYAATSTGRISSSPATIVTAAIGVTAGDINYDRTVNLTDAILGLRIVTGTDTTGQIISTGADVNGDGKLGLPETLYILQKAAGVRQ